jgi:RimJ/RimL family protein N-acetyltransferase
LSMPAPLIETARLRLRPHCPGDLPECTAMWADPAVTRFTSGRAFNREEVWARLLRYAGHWLWMEYGFWAIEDKATGCFAGELGFAEVEREMNPKLDMPEAGWALAKQFHGRGYGSEALDAALEWADERMPATTCMIHPENFVSLRLAAKYGYRDPVRAVYKGQATIVLRRQREW